MEGSGSNGKRIGDGLPPVGRRSNRRTWRAVEENPNNADNNGDEEEINEIAAAAEYNYMQPQPQQVVGGEDSRSANRRYSNAYRQRRENHLQSLQNQQDNLEVEITQNITRVENLSLKKSMLEEENVILEQELEGATANVGCKEGETEELMGEIDKEKKRNEEEQQQIMNTMANPNFYDLQQAIMDTMVASLGLGHLFPLLPPPPSDDIHDHHQVQPNMDDDMTTMMNPPPPNVNDLHFGGYFGYNNIPPHHPQDPRHQPGPSGSGGGMD